MKKIATVIMILFVLFSCTAVPLYADAWFPPDDMANEYLLSSFYDGSSRSTINIFLSNYIETGIISFDKNSSEDTVITAMLKHFELNAESYGAAVKSGNSSYGQFMMIKASEFESRTKTIFRRNISATDVKGYDSGWIYATSENYNTPIRCFASAMDITYIGNGEYMASFGIFVSSKSIEGLYGVSYYDLEAENLTSLGQGYCYFTFNNPTAQKFKPSDFMLVSIDCDKYTVPHNTPCVPCKSDGTPFEAEESTEQTASVSDETTTYNSDTTSKTETPKTTEKDHKNPASSSKQTADLGISIILTLIIASVIVISAVVITVVLIVVFATRKKK